MAHRKKILIVDDDFSTRRLVDVIIKTNFKCDVLHAGDGSEGLQSMLKTEPDLVILDMIMPFMNGIQVLKTMKSNAKLAKIPIIACTAVGDNAVVKQILTLGVKDYIIKPIDKSAIILKISDILEEPVKSK